MESLTILRSAQPPPSGNSHVTIRRLAVCANVSAAGLMRKLAGLNRRLGYARSAKSETGSG